MRITVYKILFVMLCMFPFAEMTYAGNKAVSRENGNTYVLIASGINKNSKERIAKDHAVTNLCGFLLDNVKVESGRLSVLAARESSVRKDSIISTADNLKKEIDRFSKIITSRDKFIFYYLGQANVVSGTLRLNLPGDDITHKQLAEWIKGIKASSFLIVLDCPGAGLAVTALTEQNRIIIGACTADQHYSTKFSEYFVPALNDESSDADKDGRISLLEAFTSASKGVDDFYRSQALLTTETPVLEDNADGIPGREPWRYMENKKDGLASSKFFLSTE